MITAIWIAIALATLVMPLAIFRHWYQFSKSVYKKETGNRYLPTITDKGLNGEYQTSNVLQKTKGYHKTILNCYLPNGKGKMTEIDLVFLHQTGVYVLESKNYSGWIFGREEDKNWTQTFPNGKKQSFYNPIKQNRTHVNALRNFLNTPQPEHFKSLIIFSERCELKKITVESNGVHVIKRNSLSSLMKTLLKKRAVIFTKEEIDHMYDALKLYSQVGDEVKQDHIDRLKRDEEVRRGEHGR